MINFVKYQGRIALASTLMFAALGAFAVYKYSTEGHVFTYSVDFTGGTQVLLKFDQKTSPLELQGVLESHGWAGATARGFSDTEVMIRVKEFTADTKGLTDRMTAAINEAMPGRQITVLESMAVGPGVGADLRSKSVYAVLISLLILLIYSALRFWSLGFAMGAVLALFHDAIIMLMVFAILNREISVNVIGAILAILGYSINDTIVIFARIRENIKGMPGTSLGDVVNISLNQTLRRTTLTSFATALTVVSMLVLGGPVLFDFALALLVGIIFGTYSSIYIASPLMMLVNKIFTKQQS
jgi:preprotein translocase subunit SecF